MPKQVGFATKPELATAMICRALDAGVPAAWVTGDEVYGASSRLQGELEARQIGYVLAVACDHHVRFGGATCRVDGLLRRWRPTHGDQAGRRWLMVRRNRKTSEQRPFSGGVLCG